jgi:uncharacterized protein (DUF2249 family)
MNSEIIASTIDVTAIPPRERHPAVFKAWAALDSGSALLLVNDHDPLPLYYQFACEYNGGFRWEYLAQGPGRWQVRITKGDFPNPGFVPTRKAMPDSTSPLKLNSPRVVDTRPLFARGDSPCGVIDEAMASLVPGQSLVILVPFEPVPLYAKLGKQGFLHQSRQLADGAWRIEFFRAEEKG